jgi:2-polyprenyl-3-methyl-5-hydroxy-6-metoxy-1,4-benzoquinol methylase
VTCPYCGGESAPLHEAMDWNQRTSVERFRYRRCRSCALRFIERIPQDLSRYYVNEQYDIPADAAGFAARAATQHWKVEILNALTNPGPLLEVGPATGEFAVAAREAGYAPTLLEMDQACCRFLRDSLGLTVTQTADPAACLDHSARYRAICIWQAIEHVPEFWTLMERAADRLAPGGVMILSTPNPESLQARLLGRRWPHLDAPRHLYLIPQSWMRSFADKHHLSVALDTTRDVGSLGLNFYGWYLAVRNAMRRRESSRAVEFAAGKLAALFRRWESAEGRGCSYTFAFRR